MDTTIITMKRPARAVPYFFESEQGIALYSQLISLRESAAGFMGLSVERSEDDLVIVYHMSWSSRAARAAFAQENTALTEKIAVELKEYNLLNGIVRRQSQMGNT
jgi:hypothetical protein